MFVHVIAFLFSKLPWPGNSDEILRSLSPAAHLSTTCGGKFTLSLFSAKRQAGKL